ncbi:MAG: sulfite exporter TauE/SafE family protein [Gemmatimonadaceae bacterium]
MTLLLGILAASLLGSIHCAGMCGGFVCFYAGTAGSARASATWTSHAAYSLGRLTTYLTLGALAGLLGGSLDRAGALVGVSRFAAVIAGTMLVLWGTTTVLALRGIRLPSFLPSATSRLGAPIAGVVRALRDQPPTLRALGTGIVTTLIPCGWLYTFVAAAGGTGHIASAMMVMLVFWAGTLPVMVSLGVGAQRAFGPMRRRLPALSAAAVVVLGLLSLTGRLHPPSMHGMPGMSPSHEMHGQR